MQTLFKPLFQPFSIINYPNRYFILLFILILGAIHLVNDLYLIFTNKEFMDVPRLVLTSLIFSVLVFISQYFKQKKLKQTSANTIIT